MSADITVEKLLECYPRLVRLFVDLGLSCVGCSARAFHTTVDVAREHQIDLDELRRQIHETIADS